MALASTSGIALAFAVFSRSLSVATDNAGIGFSIFFAVIGVILAGFRIFWALLSKALAIPQGIAVYNRENVIRSRDILVVLANVNLIGTHLVGSLTSLRLLKWID